mgnify:CR=1 FL=1
MYPLYIHLRCKNYSLLTTNTEIVSIQLEGKISLQEELRV